MKSFNCMSLIYNREQEMLFWKIKDTGMPNFCLAGLKEFRQFSTWVLSYFSHPDRPLKFIVSGSEHDGIYNMGGDLPFFLECIRTKQTELLTQYAHLCIEAIYDIYNAFGLPAITIALVEGNAYGGGFECAMAHDFIIAEENVQLGLPENKFNLFPGMGAYSLLYRKLNYADADALIRSGNVYKSRYLQSLGLVEKIAKKEEIASTLLKFTSHLTKHFNFEYHHIQCKKMINPLSKKELLDITNIWVDACMKISDVDLRRMEILAAAQSRKSKVML